MYKRAERVGEKQRAEHERRIRPGTAADRRAEMTSAVYISLLVVVLATGYLCKPLSGGMALERSGKYPSTFGGGSLSRRGAPSPAEELISRLLPQIQGGLLDQPDRYQLRDVLHQMHDRDYTGWMDFGRRSVEDYELDS
ncbi:gastrin/cholecystokinin-like peptide isoform X2 [Narcine bancroftii]|uniref:gastrin/cholecystokinin-like peptide isoform X2 n=1 Tax=Narcine bancroftii TaxID=1343680 RepID=UPI00383161C2